MTKTIPEVLECMDEFYSSPDRWIQRKFFDLKDDDVLQGACLVGCIIHCTEENERSREGMEIQEKVFDLFHKVVGIKTIAWNDAPGRTFEDVKAAIAKAKELAL